MPETASDYYQMNWIVDHQGIGLTSDHASALANARDAILSSARANRDAVGLALVLLASGLTPTPEDLKIVANVRDARSASLTWHLAAAIGDEALTSDAVSFLRVSATNGLVKHNPAAPEADLFSTAVAASPLAFTELKAKRALDSFASDDLWALQLTDRASTPQTLIGLYVAVVLANSHSLPFAAAAVP